MSSKRQEERRNFIASTLASIVGLGTIGGVAIFNHVYGPSVQELENLESRMTFATEGSNLVVERAAANFAYDSAEVREQKMLNVSLGIAASLEADGKRYEQLNSDPVLNDVVCPINEIINPKFPIFGSTPTSVPAGYIAGGALVGIGLLGMYRARLSRSS